MAVVANSRSSWARVPRGDCAPESSPLALGFASTHGPGAHSSSGALPRRPFRRHILPSPFAPPQISSPAPAPASYPAPGGWDQAGLIAALNQMAEQRNNPWVLDTGATSHMSSNDGILLSRLSHSPSFITVGNGNSIPISCRGTSSIPIADYLFQLNNVLIAPHLVRNLLSVRQLTRDNNCSVEFDAFGFSIKDLKTKTVILRCNSGGDLYTIPPTHASSSTAATSPLLRPRCGTHVLVILHQPPLVNLIKFQLFHVIMQHVVFVMLASSANTRVCPLLVHHLALLPPLNSFIAMSGHHRCLASQVLSTIL